MDIVLVHGSYHGAWCWDRLRPGLERRGHHVIAVELPISDPALAGADYAQAVVDAIPVDSQPLLVGHSMGGLVVPLVASMRAVRGIVFLAAFLPVPGLSANDQRASEALDPGYRPKTAEWADLGDGVWMVGPATATEIFFHDADPADARWATDRLRPQSYRVMEETTPLVAWPDVPCRSIVCRDDHAIDPDWVRSAAHDRLGTVAVEIDGGHSPFLTRPEELAGVLDAMAVDMDPKGG
jgi:pimeloyl-ACP methyl ester carboxylesterase